MADRIKHAWLWLSSADLKTELRQLDEEGRDFAPLQSRFDELIALDEEELFTPRRQAQAAELLDDAQQLPLRAGYEYDEPSDLEGIRALRPDRPRQFAPLDDDRARRHIRAAWMGRCVGCFLGKAAEGLRTDKFWPFLQASGQWPIRTYLRYGIDDLREQFPEVTRRDGCDDMQYMPVDDDTNYTTTGYLLAKKHGLAMTPADVANFWMGNIPLLATCTAERVAYRNFALHVQPPASASLRNPYREWIGAQIRADGLAYVALGRPELAADLAWRDASISHVKNGIYGEMWVAAMIAAAPFAENLAELIEIGLSEIPQTSRLWIETARVLSWHADGLSYDDAVAAVHKQWNELEGHDWCHTISNAMLCAVAMLWGEGDFGLSVCRAVQPGFDTDCNGATVGSILGMRLGEVPAEWSDRLNDTLRTSLAGHDTVKISEMGDRTFEVYQQLRQA